MMKPQELKRPQKIRDLSLDELRREESEITEHLMKLRFQMASGQIENPQLIRAYRRGLARVKTILAEKQRPAGGN
ncbi:MAG: 50S ribosomal protein L29 [Acidobacteriota bacterium]|mgnify:CR=1 FL=1|jgi:large subunit ribosomal protein L29